MQKVDVEILPGGRVDVGRFGYLDGEVRMIQVQTEGDELITIVLTPNIEGTARGEALVVLARHAEARARQ